VTISFNLKPGVALGDAVDASGGWRATRCRRRCRRASRARRRRSRIAAAARLILLMAIVVIYIVLGILYESFTHPLTILSGLPSPASARC
jgi:multidrug efflux pump subunit AcrB